jgi:hypothetical protein
MSEGRELAGTGMRAANMPDEAEVRDVSTRAGWIAIVVVILGLSGFLAWEVPRISQVTAAHTDFVETVYGLRAFVAGADPYGDAVAAHVDALMAGHAVSPPADGHYEHPFDYLLPPSLLYLPFIGLPDETAIIAARALTVALYLVAWLALVWRFGGKLPAAGRAALLLLGLAWWPFLSVILPIVQQAGTVFALIALATLAAERGRWGWAGAAAFVALVKPTESAPVVAMLALLAWRTRAARRPFLSGFLAIGLPTTLVAFARRPTWVTDWLRVLASLQAGHFAYEVNPLTTAATLIHIPVAIVYAAAAIGCGVFYWTAWQACGHLDAAPSGAGDALWWRVGASCLLTLLIIPRTGAYDVVITLMPWCVALGAAGALQGARRWLASAVLFVLLAGVGLLAYRDHAALELPLMSVALVPVLWLCRPERASPSRVGTDQALVPATAGTQQP